ncbi:hypothetical protein SERLADRAFT_438364 [Serpula lacrymans var. lacrymans S7.9]|uniref:Uncharacterized protein n=1 Tax=Serpula lacrymans var. lacrymans (strain S7.9) TaxID=578457 RepID=F8NXT6_SERL9|nr:uncharacterized protein SERLADRAFT_438364 [Serpula lacrymans var. lacrymans S7.9]EGO24752.1 hypothetical protein SERLADRAFT_438364 [Serpula lacrymans var. lacrymans S7.9]
MALVIENQEEFEGGLGLAGLLVAQARAVFQFPQQFGVGNHVLVYVEWLTHLHEPDPISPLPQVL